MGWQHNFLNFLTLSRIPLALGVFYFLVQRNYPLALSIFLVAVITDWLDGTFARKYHIESEMGEKILEPLADSLLVFIPLIGLIYIDILPLSYFLFYCLIGLISQVAKHSYKKYYSKIHFLQILYLFSAQIIIVLWLAGQISRGWIITVLIIYLLAAYFKKARLKFFSTFWRNKISS